MQDLDALVKDALAAFASTGDADALEQTKARYLGKTGILTERLKTLGKLPAGERPAMGARINAAFGGAGARRRRARVHAHAGWGVPFVDLPAVHPPLKARHAPVVGGHLVVQSPARDAQAPGDGLHLGTHLRVARGESAH